MPLSEDARALIDRLDAHLELNTRVLERNEAAFERNTQAFERNTQAFERNTQAFERNTRVWGRTVSAMTAIRNSIEDMRDEIRAQTPAIYKIIDRLDEGQQA